jgi:hypothetical protein
MNAKEKEHAHILVGAKEKVSAKNLLIKLHKIALSLKKKIARLILTVLVKELVLLI